MCRALVFLFILISASLASTATQTEWSGGSGVQGPVSSWADTFWNSDDNVIYNSGILQLSPPIPPVEHNIDGSFDGAISVYPTDVDGDGDTDVIGSSIWGLGIVWWENTDGTGTTWTEHVIDELVFEPRSAFSTDVDGDGDADVLAASNGGDALMWWENIDGIGATWSKHTVDGYFGEARSVYATDIDGDGDEDIIGASLTYSAGIAWWENTDGTGVNWSKHTVDGDFYDACSVFSVDVDGDGDADIIGAGYEVAWWENADGTGINWTKHSVGGDSDEVWSVYSSDIDGDGDGDILGAALSTYEITWWENTDNTGTTWIEHTVDGDFDGACSVNAEDIDGDGDADIVGAAHIKKDITWWENSDGTGTTWTEHLVDGAFDGACSVYLTDVDGDGNTDILGGAYEAGDVTWWDIAFSPSGTLESSILDTGDVDEWNIFLSSSEVPPGASVSFQFRSSNDYSNMGAWSDTVFSPDTPLVGILDDSTRYLQYKVILETTEAGVSPELAEVAFSYTQVGIGESESGEVLSWALSISDNPSYGLFSALVSVPEDVSVELSLYDVCGRMVAEVSQELPAGTHSVNFAGLTQGVYFCTMRSGDFSATERIVVLD